MDWNIVWEVLTLILILNCVCGAITGSINTSKGYKGGFAWGLLLGVFGIIAVECRPYEISYQCRMMAESLKFSQPNTQSEIPQTSALSKLQSISSGTAATKRCDNCDTVMPINSSFCPKCGKSFKR